MYRVSWLAVFFYLCVLCVALGFELHGRLDAAVVGGCRPPPRFFCVLSFCCVAASSPLVAQLGLAGRDAPVPLKCWDKTLGVRLGKKGVVEKYALQSTGIILHTWYMVDGICVVYLR